MEQSRTGRVVRRRLRQVLRHVHAPRARFVYSERYRHSISGLPIDPHRADQILTFLAREGLVWPEDVVEPEPVELRALCAVHTADYVERLSQPGALTSILGVEVTPDEQDRVLALQRLMVGGTIEAVRLALEAGLVGVNLGGGFHHARSDRGAGFCVFNDIAVAIHAARARGFGGRVLVIDLDLHDGDGTRRIFADDASVHTLSVHNDTWDDAPVVEATSIALGAELVDATYLAAIEEHLPPVLRRFRPELVIYLAGADPAGDDRIGYWRISEAGLAARERLVLRLVAVTGRSLPLAIVLGGGYGGQAWRYAARLFSLLLGGYVGTLPSTEEVTLARFRYLRRLVHPDELTGAQRDNGWSFSEEDVLGDLGHARRETRFLGYYAPQGIELALERYGFLDELRALGFRRPTLELDLDPLSGHTLKVFGDADRKELLVELRVSRDRATWPGMELLKLEWLLLQNPRLGFTDARPRLPGQQHPGLGLLSEVAGLLVLICERLGLEGIAFVTGHYHLAAVSTTFLHFRTPQDEARFRAIRRACEGLGVAQASWAIADGKLRDAVSGAPVRWETVAMLLPVSPELERVLKDPARRDEVTRLATAFHFALATGS
ncbi:MAG: histone deacetylase [Myxococcota bacterium]